jgi:large subunit ribosomal protein L17
MRHRVKKTPRLNIQKDHRVLLLRNLATCLVDNESLQTTEAKARALTPYFERLISMTKSKPNWREKVRYVKSELLTEAAQKKLVNEIAVRYADRKSGFVRTTPISYRRGDGVMKVAIELV